MLIDAESLYRSVGCLMTVQLLLVVLVLCLGQGHRKDPLGQAPKLDMLIAKKDNVMS